MAEFVSADWLEERVDAPDVLVLDPRRPMRYLQGHVRHALNLPLLRAFDADERLLPVDALQAWVGAAGVDDRTVVLYDAHDGRYGAMLAWLLEYLGHPDVRVLDVFLERWIAEGRPIFYRPVKPVPREFAARVNPRLRVTLPELRGLSPPKLIDTRSRDEFVGTQDTDGRPGHIPGATNLVWLDLLGSDGRFLASDERLRELAARHEIEDADEVVPYCRTGIRAAVGYLAFQRLGCRARLYDGSYLEWIRSGLPVVTENPG
jgi:thiosulfate/3-mercaptopyruvate sulfurtransferase